jgi:hypothetical protein
MESIDYRKKMRLGVETWGVSTLAFIFRRIPVLSQNQDLQGSKLNRPAA